MSSYTPLLKPPDKLSRMQKIKNKQDKLKAQNGRPFSAKCLSQLPTFHLWKIPGLPLAMLVALKSDLLGFGTTKLLTFEEQTTTIIPTHFKDQKIKSTEMAEKIEKTMDRIESRNRLTHISYIR